jgi:heme exporter protein A
MPDSLLKISNLACQRGDRLLFESVNFEISEGQLLHLIGPNGSGKTSLIRLVAGIGRAEQGEVFFQNTAIHKSENYAKQRLYIAHKDGLKNELSAFENLRFYQNLNGETFDSDKLDQSLNKLGILHCAELPAGQLSFGQRRRLAFAKLLVSDCALWILDEPFTGIDIAGRQVVEQIILEHLDQRGAVILTHHNSLQGSSLSHRIHEYRLGE